MPDQPSGSTAPDSTPDGPGSPPASLRTLRFPGVWVATTTPFGDDGVLDLDAYGANCTALLDGQVSGLVPGGSLGEYETMTDHERRALLQTAVDIAGDRRESFPASRASRPPRRCAGPRSRPRSGARA